MGHLVRYRSLDGSERFEDVADLDVAVARVERLRNDEGVEQVWVYREVPLEFRTYYRVAVISDRGVPAQAVPVPPPAMTAGSHTAEPTASSEPPSGAMPLTPPPGGRGEEAEHQTDTRRLSLFGRGQAS